MATRKEENENTSKVKATPYALAWPEQLQIEPIIKMEVSPTRSAHVYKDLDFQRDINMPVECYRVIYVITKTGRPPVNSESPYDLWGGRTPGVKLMTLLDVRLAIEQYAVAMQPKTKTITQKVKIEVNGEEDE